MHMRIAKVLEKSRDFDEEEALAISDSDWSEDIARFSGTNHLGVWLDDIRNKFRDAAAQEVALHGFTGLFARYDTDGAIHSWCSICLVCFKEHLRKVRLNALHNRFGGA